MLTEQEQLAAILQGAAFATLTDRAFLRITGADATRWLNGMVTNSVQALAPGEGNYNFLLNAQGRIQGDCMIYRDPGSESPEFLLETHSSQLETVQNTLDRFIIMDDVELTPAYVGGQGLFVAGPRAEEALRIAGLPPAESRHLVHAHVPEGSVLILSALASSTSAVEIHADPTVLASLAKALTSAGAAEVDARALEYLRLIEGRPLFGTDIRDRDLPQETAQTHALHFAKGCYLGQEIVERIRSRGQVHRQFTSFELTGSLPELPAPLEANGKPAGELTSAALVPLPDGAKLLALGYARREALDTSATLTYSGGTAAPRFKP